MTNRRTTKETGDRGEALAAEWLRRQGYRILERNFACRSGEIDIIAEKDCRIVFVEVKYRKTERFGSPLEAVPPAKQEKILKTAMYYLYRRGIRPGTPLRFDVIGIVGTRILHVEDAFRPL